MINQPLIIVGNPKKKGKRKMARTIHMKRNRKGQFVKGSSNAPRKKGRKHKARRNYYSVGAVVPNKPHRRGRRNPPALQLAGVQLPDLGDVLAVSVGVAGPPLIQGFAAAIAPTAITNKTTKTLVQVGSWVVPPLAAAAFFGKASAKKVLQGELVSLAVQGLSSLVTSLQRSIVGNGVSGYMRAGQAAKLLSGMGSYYRPGGSRTLSAAPNWAAGRVPVRLQSRFSTR